MPDFFPQYPTTSHPVFGSIESMPAQLYNWEQMNVGQQRANVAGDIAAQQQAIANRNNLYQFARANEMEDARRQLAARELGRREAADRAGQAQRAYLFQEQMAFQNKELQASIEADKAATKAKFSDRSAAEKAGAESALVVDLDKGLHPERTWGEIATIYGLTPTRSKQIGQPIRDTYLGRQVAELNSNLGDIVAKTPNEKIEWQDFAGLIPDSLRGLVEFNRLTHRYERIDRQGAFPINMGQLDQGTPLAAPQAARTPSTYADAALKDIFSNPAQLSNPITGGLAIGKLAAAPIRDWFSPGGPQPESPAPSAGLSPSPTPTLPPPSAPAPVPQRRVTKQDVDAAKAELDRVMASSPDDRETFKSAPGDDFFKRAVLTATDWSAGNREAAKGAALDRYRKTLDAYRASQAQPLRQLTPNDVAYFMRAAKNNRVLADKMARDAGFQTSR